MADHGVLDEPTCRLTQNTALMDDLERLDLGSELINLRLKAGQALGTLATIDRCRPTASP
jgi:hypothetical protein